MTQDTANRLRQAATMLAIEFERIGTPEESPAEVARLVRRIRQDSEVLEAMGHRSS